MDKKLCFSAMTKFVLGLVCTAVLLFLPAGTIRFPRGWLLIAILFVPMLAAGLVLLQRNPELLRLRLQAKEAQGEQRLVDTGLYGIVRHPMYGATVLLFLSMPLVLGSWVSLVVFLPYPVLIANRINHEERMLERELMGYTDYKTRVNYRLIPYIW